MKEQQASQPSGGLKMQKCVPCWESTVNNKEVLFSLFTDKEAQSYRFRALDFFFFFLDPLQFIFARVIQFCSDAKDCGTVGGDTANTGDLTKSIHSKSHVPEGKGSRPKRLGSARKQLYLWLENLKFFWMQVTPMPSAKPEVTAS